MSKHIGSSANEEQILQKLKNSQVIFEYCQHAFFIPEQSRLYFIPDIFIFADHKKQIVIGAIEFKQSLHGIQKSLFLSALRHFNLNFIAATDGKSVRLYQQETESDYTFSDFIIWLKEDKYSKTDINNILQILSNSKVFKDHINFRLEIKYSTLMFTEKSERDFWDILVPKKDYVKFVRYTSIASLFRLLKDQKYSMCSTAGFNDRREGQFFENNKKNIKLESDLPFVMSFVREEEYCDDNFDMWRFYGDNLRGAALTFKLNGISKSTHFTIRPIIYLNKNDNIFKLMSTLLELVKQGKFRFREYDKWKYFFKSKQYESENEVRLYYSKVNDKDLGTTEWTFANNLFFEIKKFDSTDFPMELTNIKLGSNCPNIDNLTEQIQKMWLNIKPTTSVITNFYNT